MATSTLFASELLAESDTQVFSFRPELPGVVFVQSDPSNLSPRTETGLLTTITLRSSASKTPLATTSFKVHGLAPIALSHMVTAAELAAPGTWGVYVTNDSLVPITFSTSVAYPTVAAPRQTLPNLHSVRIIFNTHDEDDRDNDTVLHVFVKNRSSDTSFVENAADYISNHLAFQKYEASDPYDVNPYLAVGEGLSLGQGFGGNSTHSFNVPLRAKPIPCGEIVLPMVDIHILPNGDDTWVFDYIVQFFFADPEITTDPNHRYDFNFSSNTDGVTGIILSENNRNYSGIGVENPHADVPTFPRLPIDSVLTKVALDFHTLGDDKDPDTKLNVHIVNRLSATASQDIAIGINLLPNTQFKDGTVFSLPFEDGANALASSTIRLQDIVLPLVNVIIYPNGNDTWEFDVRVTYFFSMGERRTALQYESTTSGIMLNQNESKRSIPYRGGGFPSSPPIPAQLTAVPSIEPDHQPKRIPLSLLRRKLDELLNLRQSLDPQSQSPALFKIRLHNSGLFQATPPGNYYDLAAINANPPIPGTVMPPNYLEGVRWDSNPSDQGPDEVATKTYATLNDINGTSLTLQLTPSGPTQLLLSVTFETGGPPEVLISTVETGVIDRIDVTQFNLTLGLTLNVDPKKQRIDVMSWVADLESPNNLIFTRDSQDLFVGTVTGIFLGKPVSVRAASLDQGKTILKNQVFNLNFSAPGTVFEGMIRSGLHDAVYKSLSNPNHITGSTTVDSLNAQINSWLLGGITDRAVSVLPGDNTCKVSKIEIDTAADELQISYTGPQYAFEPTMPAVWPPPYSFSSVGPLTKIDHIVVLTMENRSFDHMLGYLSLPVNQGGMGRTEVDGLQGGEKNLLRDGTVCLSKPFLPGETIFAPDPPHSFTPVTRAINGGKMDGFAEAYTQEHGPVVGPNIMKYHTAVNVPTYDALARDFAIGHRWFAGHPGPTFCNRFTELTGRLNIDPNGFWELSNSSPLRPVFTKTIFDHLTDAGVSWKYFENHYCFLRFFEKHTFDNKNIFSYDDPGTGFANTARTGNLPSVTFIDPHFVELPPGGNCDGPPADVRLGQQFVKEVVEAVVTSPSWEKTLLIVTYDEHGGFYDHVPPPPAVQVAPGLPATYGVRVPVFVISPWVASGTVFGHDAQAALTGTQASLYFDHTSILKTIATRFLSPLLGPKPPYMGARYAAANDLSALITEQKRSGQFLPFIGYNLLYAKSQMRLDIPGGEGTPGLELWQYSPNTTGAQLYSFEDAGGGFVYIRTHPWGLYVTVDAPSLSSSPPLRIKQDRKYSAASGGNTDYQKWSLTSSSATTVEEAKMLTIRNAAFTHLALQPLDGNLQAQAAVVLATPAPDLFHPNAWLVSSPSSPDNSGNDGPPTPPPPPPPPTVSVPNVVGATVAQANLALNAVGLFAKFVGPTQSAGPHQPVPTVTEQTPAEGKVVDKGLTVTMITKAVLPQ